ncbi:hypothetical protein Nepgr_033892 [Nepenthes gracilis]|uniref:Uncharacterized protein n=1 Tax=Nepenthes gracilis TaxID=150966 RepID=A0AAD3TN36_NEPGR|nr:hypothetical protein Nepgr_033892 [Nepenthes gracilis]
MRDAQPRRKEQQIRQGGASRPYRRVEAKAGRNRPKGKTDNEKGCRTPDSRNRSCLSAAPAYPARFHGGVDGWWLDFLLLHDFVCLLLPMEVLRDYEANCIDFVMPWSPASFVLIFVMLSPAEGGSDCLAMELC